MVRLFSITAWTYCYCQFDPKFQVEEVASTNHSSSQKTKLNDLSYDVKIWTDLSSVLSQCTRLTDGQANRQTAFS